MYNLGDHDEKKKKLLSFFAVLPAERISFDTLQSILPSWKTLEDTLLALAKKGWLDYNELNTSFKVTPIIQEITKRKNLNLLEDCHQLVGALKDKLNFDPGTGQFTNASYVEVILYARYTEALISSVEQTDYKFAQLLENLVSYHTTCGILAKALPYCQLYPHFSNKLH